MGPELGAAIGEGLTATYGAMQQAQQRKFQQAKLDQAMKIAQMQADLERDTAHLRAQTELQVPQVQADAQARGRLSEWMGQQKAQRDQREQDLANFDADPDTTDLAPQARQRYRLGEKYPGLNMKPIPVKKEEMLLDPLTNETLVKGAPAAPTAEQDKAKRLDIGKRQRLGQPVTPDETAWAKSYDADKTLGQRTTFELNAGNKTDARLDKSYQQASSQLGNLRKPLADRSEKIADLEDILNEGTPQADSLVAPKLLSVTVGGQGSGLRMNEAEIARIIGGRSKWQSLKAAMQQWSTDPKAASSLTPEQKTQIRSIVSGLRQHVNGKLSTIDNGAQQLIDAGDVDSHRRILADVQNKLTGSNRGGPQTSDTNTDAGYIYARDSNGQLHRAKAGTALPKGWKPEAQ